MNNQQPTPLEAFLLARRDALLLELRFIDKQLGIEPKERVLCPSCRKERSKAA